MANKKSEEGALSVPSCSVECSLERSEDHCPYRRQIAFCWNWQCCHSADHPCQAIRVQLKMLISMRGFGIDRSGLGGAVVAGCWLIRWEKGRPVKGRERVDERKIEINRNRLVPINREKRGE